MNWFACLLGYLFGTKMNQPICNYGIRLPRNDDHHIVILYTQQQKKNLIAWFKCSCDLSIPWTIRNKASFYPRFIHSFSFNHLKFIVIKLLVAFYGNPNMNQFSSIVRFVSGDKLIISVLNITLQFWAYSWLYSHHTHDEIESVEISLWSCRSY